METILITGGTGLIGKALNECLTAANYKVHILTRTPKNEGEFAWDLKANTIDKRAFEGVSYIIHLAGAGIADKKWTANRKKELVDSRVHSTKLLYQYVRDLKIPLKKFISASGIGYYGSVTGNRIFQESDAPGNDFIANLCVAWEQAGHQFDNLSIPVSIFRTGVVLSKSGGALKKMNTPLVLNALGSGKQALPWIHIDDLCGLYLEAVQNETLVGVFNAVAPEKHSNHSFMQALARTLKKPLLPLNVPGFVLKLLLGELASIVLEGSSISAEKTQKHYPFKYPKLFTALDNLYRKN